MCLHPSSLYNLNKKADMKNQEQEIWKDIPNYEGYYQVSSHGRVKSLDRVETMKNKVLRKKIGKILKPYQWGCKGYERYGLMNKSFYTHQLVAMAFLGHTPCGHSIHVDHIDNNKRNNHVSNLQVISARENNSKDRNIKKGKKTGVYKRKNSKLYISVIKYEGKNIKLGSFKTEEEASEYYQNALKSIENGTEIKVKKPNYSSKYKGVRWNKKHSFWQSYIQLNKKAYYLGSFKTEECANEAYIKAALDFKKNKLPGRVLRKSSSKYIGVSLNNYKGKWMGKISFNKKDYYIGLFDNEYDAHLAVEKKRKELNR
jgi:hypothetical protein